MCGIVALFFLTSAYGNSSPSPASKLQHEPFIGQDRWEPEYLDMCEMEEAEQSSLYCGMYDFNYQRIHFEVVSDEPILIIFRNLLSPQHVEALLDDISAMDIYPQKVINMSSEKYDDMDDTSRVANGTYIHHHATPQFAKAFKISQQVLPFVNFYTSESWQVLSYLPGGHYAHHYDYIIYKEEASYDDGWKSTGNRFATFLIVLQNAEQGGESSTRTPPPIDSVRWRRQLGTQEFSLKGTVFPQLNTTVKASPGDAIFWINMDAEQKCVSCLPHDPVI
ncbi:unnamed protein product [Nippostrongylus brasiliensis]|uniref:P4Hc domain-containing protein n=1 Tax=Nippostrongylus brasiliensis TaxID=27835 RepID=A0A0N4YK73_NIPBR|nr:unnamed protein product [Nippostrongylus brasiliensis]